VITKYEVSIIYRLRIQSFDYVHYIHIFCVHHVVVFVDELELFKDKVVSYFGVIKVVNECEAGGGGVVTYHKTVELVGLVIEEYEVVGATADIVDVYVSIIGTFNTHLGYFDIIDNDISVVIKVGYEECEGG